MDTNKKLVLTKITIDNLHVCETTIPEIFTLFQPGLHDGPGTAPVT